jgi:signal transduction histidine kinase
VDGPFVVERLTALTHDLANLLDGSMRCLGLARRALGRELAVVGAEEIDETRRQVDTTVYGALERMADLVQAAMRGSAAVVSPGEGGGRAITLQEAIAHAARVVAPEALGLKVRVDVSFSDELAGLPAGPLYTVVLNGLRNALESIGRLPESARRDGGRVQILALVRQSPRAGRRFVIIEVLDDGAGIRSAAAGARAFEIGNSSKPGGMGVGLALAREVVREVSGTIELRPRPDIADRIRPGAILRIMYAMPKDPGPRRRA